MSPGYLPFKDALDLPAYLCDNCGSWQRQFAPPPDCPLCLDARHVVPQTGWRFWTEAEARDNFPCHWAEVEPGIWRYWNDPVNGIGPSAYLVTTPAGNMMFEACSVFSEAALAHLSALGGVDVLSASHPHSYGALWQIQDRFDPELALPVGDFLWSAALRVSWPYDDRLEPLPGLELHVTGGHFEGHAVLFDRGRGILFCGDALKFELDSGDPRRARTISAHKAFVRGVPLTLAELRRYREVFAALPFGQTWTPFEQAANCGRAEVLALVDAMLATRPHAAPVPLDDLVPTPDQRPPSLA
ncbi:MBL fold metallo-hydrolase [uncultured Enterovirga sp.]|uniref:MBL fold metallo-hydrolase n=1 Tax=uncultured Enterovirga sp. TaxID=2026352 RepID=UPI0035C96060